MKKIQNDIYYCNKCRWEVKFCPEDYGPEDELPTTCPMCLMPISQMIKDVWDMEGFRGISTIIELLIARLK